MRKQTANLNGLLQRYQEIHALGVDDIDLGGIPPDFIRHLSMRVWATKAQSFQRLVSPQERYAKVACFLIETRQRTLDQIVEMNHRYLTQTLSRAKTAFQENQRKARKQQKEEFDRILAATEKLLSLEEPQNRTVAELLEVLGEENLRVAWIVSSEFQQTEGREQYDQLTNYYSTWRRYLPEFFALPFRGQHGNTPLIEALEIVRALAPGETPPEGAPISFASRSWRNAFARGAGLLDRQLWERTRCSRRTTRGTSATTTAPSASTPTRPTSTVSSARK